MKHLLLPLLLFFLPFQKAIWKPFRTLAKAWIPQDLVVPPFFSKQIFFFPSDGILLLFFFLIAYSARKQLFSFFLEGPSKYLAAFFAVALLSLLFSPFHNYLLQYQRLFQFFIFFLFFCAVKTYFRESNKEKVFTTLAFALVLTALLQSGIAFAQFFTQGSLGLSFLGEENLKHFTFYIPGSSTLFYRASGLFTHPNVLGGFLYVSLFATAYLFLNTLKRSFQFLLSIVLLIQLAALTVTFSRAAIFAYCFSLLFFLAAALYTKILSGKKALALIAPTLLSLVICFTAFYPQLKSRGGFVNYNQVSRISDTERLVYQEMALKMFASSPWVGIGFNNFELISSHYAPKEYPLPLETKVHNIFLLILTETGLLGFICFALFMGSLLKRRERTVLSLLLYTLLIGFIGLGMCDFYLLDTQQGKLLLFTVTGLIASYPSKVKKAVPLTAT